MVSISVSVIHLNPAKHTDLALTSPCEGYSIRQTGRILSQGQWEVIHDTLQWRKSPQLLIEATGREQEPKAIMVPMTTHRGHVYATLEMQLWILGIPPRQCTLHIVEDPRDSCYGERHDSEKDSFIPGKVSTAALKLEQTMPFRHEHLSYWTVSSIPFGQRGKPWKESHATRNSVIAMPQPNSCWDPQESFKTYKMPFRLHKA